LRTFTEQYVPRDEVQEAMRAVIHEVKALKTSSITNNAFNEALKRKADETDVARLIKSLTEAMGNVDGRTSSSIVHTKCLVCDAPVNTINKDMSPPRTGYDKRSDANLSRPQTTANLMLSRSLSSSGAKIRPLKQADRVKMTSDLRIIRNSIDLPPIDPNSNVRTGSPSETPGGDAQLQQPVMAVVMNKTGSASGSAMAVDSDSVDGNESLNANKQRYACHRLFLSGHGLLRLCSLCRIAAQGYKERIRASAGGGMGLPNYKNNTR
jgi:hypothetical protein